MSENDGGAARIELVNGGFAVVTTDDLPLLSAYRWYRGTNGYVYRAKSRQRGDQCLLHRIVVSAVRGDEIHHKNGDKLDCRRCNLEITTPSRHQDHHKHILIARSKLQRIYPDVAQCPVCGVTYHPDPDHRGRQIACSRSCGTILGLRRARENIHAG